jgi:hypothetical protein
MVQERRGEKMTVSKFLFILPTVKVYHNCVPLDTYLTGLNIIIEV